MARNPDPWQGLRAELERLKADVKRLLNRSPFFGTGVHPNGNDGLDSDNYSTGVSGFSLNGATGNVEFNSMTLRGGIIGNDALANPVDGKVGNVSASGFALTAGAFTELAGQNIVVPAGFTQALATAGATVFAYNPNTTGGSNTTGGDAIYCYAQVTTPAGAVGSHANPVGVTGLGGYATSFSSAGFELNNLTPGSTLRLSVYGCSAYQGLAANPDNYANAYASVVWLR